MDLLCIWNLDQMLSSWIVNNVIGKRSFTVEACTRYTLPYIIMCNNSQAIAILLWPLMDDMWHHVNQETARVWTTLLCSTSWKAAYNVFAGSMRKLLYISSDFHSLWRLQRGPEFFHTYNILRLHHNNCKKVNCY